MKATIHHFVGNDHYEEILICPDWRRAVDRSVKLMTDEERPSSCHIIFHDGREPITVFMFTKVSP